MPKKRIVLTFPRRLVDQPITYHLIKDYDLMVNILRANVTPEEEGRLVLEVSGKKKDMQSGIDYLNEIGVDIQPLTEDVRWYKDRCTECTACISICPSGAFVVNRDTMSVTFKKDKCIACELCIPICPYHAIEVHF
ncbi:MAG: NIL domain-containing protein [Pseudomonadota bacterium]